MFTPLHTFADGDVLLATDLQGEVDAARQYIRRMPEEAFSTAAWVDTKHVMRGDYDPVSNVGEFVSGHVGGRVYGATDGEVTYITRDNTLRVGTSVWEHIPLTSLALFVRRPTTLLFQWWADGISLTDGVLGLGYGDVVLYVGNKGLPSTNCRSRVHEEDPAFNYHQATRQSATGFHIANVASSAPYRIGLVGQAANATKVQFASFGFSIEAFAF